MSGLRPRLRRLINLPILPEHTSKMKEKNISDIFHTSWDSLRSEKGGNQVIITMRYLQIVRATLDQKAYTQFGYYVRILIKSLAKQKVQRLDSEQLVDIYHDLKFLHEPWYFFSTPVIKLKSNSPLSRGVAEGRGVLHAPDERLSNITYSNFKFADAKFTKYLCHQEAGEDKEAQLELNKLMACLYCPGLGDERIFHEKQIDDHAGILETRLRPWEKLLAAETYGYIRTYIVNRETFLFPQGSNSPDGIPKKLKAKESENKPVYTGEMWQDLHYDLADTEAFKGYEPAGSANIYHALDYLNKKAREQKERTK